MKPVTSQSLQPRMTLLMVKLLRKISQPAIQLKQLKMLTATSILLKTRLHKTKSAQSIADLFSIGD